MNPSPVDRAIMLCGTAQPDSVGRILSNGPVSVEFRDGQLRYLRYRGVEVLRGVGFLVRDENWGTYVPSITRLKVDQQRRQFTVSYRATCRKGEQQLVFDVRIEGRADGSVHFSGKARARTDFLTARTGFVVLHPLTGTVGQAVELEHVDGRRERSVFPRKVDPVQPFLNLRAMTHEVLPGVRASVRMEGEAFETEDHRNWTDASFKTYVRPLAKPWPYVIKAGQIVEQSVVVSFEAPKPAPAAGRARRAGGLQVVLGRTSRATMPVVGLGVPAEEVEASLAVVDRIRLAAPGRLIGHFDTRRGHGIQVLRAYRELVEQTGAAFTLEIVATSVERHAWELSMIAREMAEAGLRPDAVAVVPVGDLKSVLPGGERPPAPPLANLYASARHAFPGAQLGGGMFSFFTELNRKRVPAELLDFVHNTTCPTVHAADDRSVMETLEALPHQVLTARSFIGRTPYRIGPSAIGCRDNPHGETYTANPDNVRVCLPNVDPRMRGLFGAAWIGGYLATLARTGVQEISIGATTGPLGIIHRPADHPQPGFAGLAAGVVYPSFHVVAGLARAAGSKQVSVTSDDPARIQCIAYRQGRGTLLWLFNLTAQSQRVTLAGLGNGARHYGVLDEHQFAMAVADPQGFQAQRRPLRRDRVNLPAYGVMFIGC